MSKIVPMLQRIVSGEVSWMADRPFKTYLFIYHFPREAGGGGMEHAYSTAIDVSAHTLALDPYALKNVTAHEFFHLWNVKRIRPQSLEPPDYTKENYTDALWFSEGVTSTVEDYMLLRAGLVDEHQFLAHLAAAIAELENRPAHLTQSAEESSLDAWLEKYSYYREPERSVSYYNKGDLLGVLLDLKIRDASNGTKSLRDLFQWMNSSYAQQNKFFSDSAGVRQAAEVVTHSDLSVFFEKYVAGTEEIPWNDFFRTVGLQLMTEKVAAADPGFTAVRNFDSPLAVVSVAENSAAERALLAKGDIIVKINGHDPSGNLEHSMAALRPGETIHVRIRNQNGQQELSWRLDTRTTLEFRFEDMRTVTAQQKARRTAWLRAESEPAGQEHP
ncbi:MAG: PDZ domain-containing protein [Terriglobales bacterium]